MDIDRSKIRRLDHGLLLVFVELVHRRKTTSVAARLDLSQSAVSHALARLRELLADPLFVRRPNGLQPTARAVALLPLAEEILGKSQALLDFGQAFAPATSARVFRIAANDLVASLYGTDLVQSMRAVARETRVTFQFAVGRQAIEALRQGVVDLAVGRFHGLPPGFSQTMLSMEDFVLVANAKHPKLKKSPDLDTFLALDHALVSFHGNLTGPIDEALVALGLSRRVVASFPVYLSAMDLVARTEVVATLPKRLAKLQADRFGVWLHPLPIAIEPFPLSIVQHESTRSDPAISWLVSRLRDLAERSG